MSITTRNARTVLVALGLVTLSAGLSLNCGSCDDDAGGDLGIDAGGLSDASSPGANNSYDEQTGVGYLSEPEGPRQIDILWVIDNSGSMCEEQRALRDNFARFATQLANQGVDFNMGVTTTHMKDNDRLEPVARPGELQSEPQPVPTPLGFCHGDAGDPDDPKDGYKEIRASIATAVACTKDPAAWAGLIDITDEEIGCQLDYHCGAPEELFPMADADGTSPYRELPRVIRSTDYDEAAKVEIERLSKDFACMSLVGSRGYNVEKGLGAAVEAVSPEMTGGSVESPSDATAPNHGLIRENAEFGLVFLTDENDCTHDGTLDAATYCGDDICAFANHPDFVDSPLLDPAALAEEFSANLSASKSREVHASEITIASIHGTWQRYGADASYPEGDAPMDLDFCSEATSPPSPDIVQKFSCESSMGRAISGDRYEAFARNFPRVYPPIPQDPDEHMPGLVCNPDQIPDALEKIGETSAQPPRCIARTLYGCGEGGDAANCPAFRFSEGAPRCVQDDAGRATCDSALEVQLLAPTDSATPASELESTGYCLAESIGADDLARGCVVDRARYDVVSCAGGISYEWRDAEQATADLADFSVRIRYLSDAYEAR